MHGWHGRILFVDLTSRSFRSEQLQAEHLCRNIGGRGLALQLFHDYAQSAPCTPDSPLILTTGPLSGTGTPATERLCMLARSPLTGTLFDTTAGGSFARMLKASGYDAVVINGAAERPLTLHITPDAIDFRPAETLWGIPTSRTIGSYPDQAVAAIGPAGEQGVLYANIVFSDGDNDGRGGLGAVMGSKNLKAIGVNGDRKTAVADPQRLQSAQQDILRLLRASPALLGPLGLHEFGTPTLVDLTNQRRMLPTDNFRSTYFPQASNLSGPALRTTLAPDHDSCCDCPIACKKTTASYGRLPEYSALSHLGPLLGISDLHAVVAANSTCRELGLDPISAAATLATYVEVTGAKLAAEDLCVILNRICSPDSPEPLLSRGARRLAEAFGKPQASMTVKSLELPAFDPRGATGIALSYCTSTIGGSHRRAGMEACEILRKPVAVDRFTTAGKARLLKNAEDARAAADSMIACPYAYYAASLEEYADVLSAVTGHEFSPADLVRTGERIVVTEQRINQRNGFTIDADQLPERFYLEPGSSGDGVQIPPLSKDDLTEELRRYMRIRQKDQSDTTGLNR